MANSDNTNEAAATENQQPVFGIEKLYVKDASIEVPGAPQIFTDHNTKWVLSWVMLHRS
jgi:preprotein translocase subunit SecB